MTSSEQSADQVGLFISKADRSTFSILVNQRKLQALDMLLEKIYQLDSPSREEQFVAGCLQIGSQYNDTPSGCF